MIILGLDPGLGTTGWGVIRVEGNRLSHIANGQFKSDIKQALAQRLVAIDDAMTALIAEYAPAGVAVEEVFVNDNPQSTLKLAHARGVILLCAARSGLNVGEYAPRFVKKAVTGVGNAGKDQVRAMVERLLPGVKITSQDASDALAVAITHAHHGTKHRGLTE